MKVTDIREKKKLATWCRPQNAPGRMPVPASPTNICLNGDSAHWVFNLFRKPGMKKQLFTGPSFHDLFL